jgi:DNA-binding transcriptional LysR family regulator
LKNAEMLTNRLLAVHQGVLREGSITGAAAILGYTVSAVSEQVRRLEAEAGSALFEKVGRGVRPTAAGLLLAVHADRILGAVDDAETALSDLRAGRTGRLRLVSFHSAGESLLPPAIAKFRENHPDVAVSPIVDETDGALRRLRAGEVDLVVVVEPFGVGGEPQDDLVRVHLGDDDYRVLLPREHPLAARRTIDLAALAASDWIVTTGPANYVREVTITTCRRAGFSPRIVAEADEFAVTQGYVAASLGVAFVPLLALGAVREHVAVRRLKTPPEARHIWVATRPAIATEPAVESMITALGHAARAALRS